MKKLHSNQILKLSPRKFLLWLKSFIKDIPEDEWCVNARSANGQHCILGHLNNVYGMRLDDKLQDETIFKKRVRLRNGGTSLRDIVAVQNGQVPLKVFDDIKSPKQRALKYINLRLANKII